MSPEREVLCCGASLWGKVLAWFQIVSSALSIFVAKCALVDLLYIGEGGFTAVIIQNPQLLEGLPVHALHISYEGLIATLVAMVAISIIGLFMGVVLLQGAKQRNARYLKAWIIYVVACWVLLCLSSVIISDPIGAMMVEGIFLTLLHAFAIWVPMAVMLDISGTTLTGNLSFYRITEEPLSSKN